MFANIAAASNAILTAENAKGEHLHYLRAMGPLNPESIATYGNRLAINRNSAYSPPLWANGLASGLPGFDTRQCSSGITATLNPNTPESESFNERTEGKVDKATDLFERIKKFAFAGQSSTTSVPAPGCTQQAPFTPIYGSGPATVYQHTFEQPAR